MKKSSLARAWKPLLVLAGMILLAAALWGQAITASLTGVVRDPQSAVVPGARVTLTHVETGRTWSLTTDAEGVFLATTLPVGTYRLEAEATGFKKYLQTGILLQVNQAARNDVRMDVGSVSEQVTVTSGAELVNTSNSTSQTTEDNKRMMELPLNGRGIFNLIFLTPGVGVNGYQGRSINGSRPETESLQMDGGDFMARMSSGGHQPNTYPPPDAVREFTVL